MLKSDLSGNFEKTALALLDRPSEYDARQLQMAMKGLGTNEAVLIEVLGLSFAFPLKLWWLPHDLKRRRQTPNLDSASVILFLSRARKHQSYRQLPRKQEFPLQDT